MQLLQEALPKIKAPIEVKTLYTDGGLWECRQ